MTIWIDAQLSPQIATWISEKFSITSVAVRDLGLRDSEDSEIFQAAREANAVVMSKDHDFVALLDRFGPPPSIIWLTCGNTSNANLRQILEQTLQPAIELLEQGEPIVEISSI